MKAQKLKSACYVKKLKVHVTIELTGRGKRETWGKN